MSNRPGWCPEDVWESARDAVFDFDCDWTADGRRRGDFEEQSATTLVARAILEERERCSTLVENYPQFTSLPEEVAAETGFLVRRSTRSDIAKAIRAGS